MSGAASKICCFFQKCWLCWRQFLLKQRFKWLLRKYLWKYKCLDAFNIFASTLLPPKCPSTSSWNTYMYKKNFLGRPNFSLSPWIAFGLTTEILTESQHFPIIIDIKHGLGKTQGVTKRCRLSCPRIWAQMRGEGGSYGVSANENSFTHGAQKNFGDLTPYLTPPTSFANLFLSFRLRSGRVLHRSLLRSLSGE